jgi:hypothetical protein
MARLRVCPNGITLFEHEVSMLEININMSIRGLL